MFVLVNIHKILGKGQNGSLPNLGYNFVGKDNMAESAA
jgi:hypothetical protein